MATVAVKMTFGFAPEAAMTLVDPEPIFADDQHADNQLMRNVVRSQETFPQLHMCDVTLSGSAYPATPGDSSVQARLMINNGTKALLDKSVYVCGDRSDSGAPIAFERITLGFETAFGGIGSQENPLGTGRGATAKLPNVLDLREPKTKTACFGAIPQSFALRRKKLDGVGRRAASTGTIEIPAEFDWSYYQAAPIDQQLAKLTGSEWILLAGMLPNGAQLRTQLPGIRALARIFHGERAQLPTEVPLKPDMLHIDTDAQVCVLVSRGSFPVMVDDALKEVVIAGGCCLPGASMQWPAADELKPGDMAASETPAPDLTGTIAVFDAPAIKSTLPFRPAGAPMAFRDIKPAAQHLRGVSDLTETLTGGRAPAKQALPFGGGPASVVQPDSERGASSGGVAIPGAPWAKQTAVEIKRPTPMSAQTLPVNAMLLMDPVKVAAAESAARLLKKAATEKAERKQAAAKAAEAEAQKVAQEAAAKERELLAKQEAAQKEAEQRRADAAKRFEQEQIEARAEAQRRADEEANKKKNAATKLRSNMYGGFKRKG